MSQFGILFLASIVLGLALGSFCGSAAYRIAHGWSLFSPPGSHCPGCGKKLSWYENIPLLSFILQRGKCRGCKSGLSLLYPLAEATAAAWSGLLFWRYGLSVDYWVFMGIGIILLLIALVDLESFFIPDLLVLIGAALTGGATLYGIGLPPLDALLAAVLGSLLLQGVRLGYRVLRGREGMGFGDVKLMFFLGLCAGTAGLPYILILAAFLAALFTVAARWREVAADTRIPFGPYLCAGCGLYIVFGHTLRGGL